MMAISVDDFVRIPFRSQGRGYGGADCWGLVYLWYRDRLGIELEAWAETPAGQVRDVARLIERHKTDWSPAWPPRQNDVALMRVMARGTSRLVAHVGIVVDGGRVMHTQSAGGVRVDRADSPLIARRVMEYRRHRLAR